MNLREFQYNNMSVVHSFFRDHKIYDPDLRQELWYKYCHIIKDYYHANKNKNKEIGCLYNYISVSLNNHYLNLKRKEKRENKIKMYSYDEDNTLFDLPLYSDNTDYWTVEEIKKMFGKAKLTDIEQLALCGHLVGMSMVRIGRCLQVSDHTAKKIRNDAVKKIRNVYGDVL